jgi:hypothetical protein
MDDVAVIQSLRSRPGGRGRRLFTVHGPVSIINGLSHRM